MDGISIKLGEREFSLRLSKAAEFRRSAKAKVLADADTFATVCILIWVLIEGSYRPEPEEIAELLPENDTDLKEIVAAVQKAVGATAKAAKKKQRNGRSSASKSG